MTIGERIRTLRKERNMTQEQLAQKIGVKRAVISKYENDCVCINVTNLEKISSVLGVTPSFLIGFDEKMLKPESFNNDELLEIKNSVWDLYKQNEKYKDSPEYKINYFFSQLNELGKDKAVERIEELTKIKDYTK